MLYLIRHFQLLEVQLFFNNIDVTDSLRHTVYELEPRLEARLRKEALFKIS